jgi:hypothetical protein
VLAVLWLRLISSDEQKLVYCAAVYLLNVICPLDGKPALAGNGSHVAFIAYDRTMVNQFYQVALIHGGTSDGAPGVRGTSMPHGQLKAWVLFTLHQSVVVLRGLPYGR